MSRTRTGKRAVLSVFAAAAAALLAGSSLVIAPSAEADDGAVNTNNYDLSATANSLDILVNDASLPLVQTAELSPYGASARVNSLGESFADAGAPYSPLVNSLPGLVSGLGAARIPPLPPLPGYVSASYPSTPKASQTQAIYDIRATTAPTEATGEVTLGAKTEVAGSSFFASAHAKANGDGSVTASATAGIDLLKIAGILDLGNVSSTVTLTQQAGEAPKITTETHLGTITVLGLTSGLLNGTLNLLGIKAPISLTDTLVPVLNRVLAPAGVTLSVLPATYVYTDGTSTTDKIDKSKTVQSVNSGALKISVAQDVPSQGTVTVDLILGQAMASVTDSPGVGPGSMPVDDGTGSGLGSVGTVTGDQPTSIGGDSGGGLMLPTDDGALPEPSVEGGQTSAPPPATQPGQGQQQPVALPMVYRHGPSAESLYLVLTIAALVAAAGLTLIRIVSVRLLFAPDPSTRT